MPLIHLASTEAEALERGINVHRIDCNNDGSVIMWTYETHHGLCLEDRERNGYDDSDWYMTLWNDENDTQIQCGGVCEGDIPGGTSFVSFFASVDGGVSTLRTTPYPPTGP